ncbi:HipA domain-containing protein [Bifidobacterium animalis]|uniref:HipA domain-containing protein n=1 Tax=Bifidobacterium animalis TaxID=28025 RepID=UPI001C3EB74B|nr:HipA domain-containing protein [Bifidobacterium animalis]MCR1995010.1 HipA domain-containing protein [Bifidobacterium animalis subsp. animalis]
MEELHVWDDGARHIGVFHRNASGHIGFEYDADRMQPISLSLPRAGGWLKRAPSVFLENLLPDQQKVRQVMARQTGAASTDTFDLLDRGDVTGGFTFTRSSLPPDPEDMPARVASDSQIAAQIIQMQDNPVNWWDTTVPTRFSLAGNQAKFSLLRMGGSWFRSDMLHPSTHILKPATGDENMVEDASMRLASYTGVPVPHTEILEFEGVSAYMVERFDRMRDGSGMVHRVHTEDLLQAMSLPPSEKYRVTVRQVMRLLQGADESNTLAYEWVQRLAVNVSLNNADAHAKNYSLLYNRNGVRLSPLYDVLTTTYWPYVSRQMPLAPGGVSGAANVTPGSWRKLAGEFGLDADRVELLARNTAWLVLEHAEQAYRELPPHVRDRLFHELELANKRIEPLRPIQTADRGTAGRDAPVLQSSPIAGNTDVDHMGQVYVHGHYRRGKWVDSYWRDAPRRG